MSNYLILNPVDQEDGLDYIFAYMGAVYGTRFLKNWEGANLDLVRQVWKKEIGQYLKSKDILDYALSNLPPDFPPSAIAFRDICKKSPSVINLETRTGVEKLAEMIQMGGWNQLESFFTYKEKVIKMAKEKGVL